MTDSPSDKACPEKLVITPVSLIKTRFTEEEDRKLIEAVKENGAFAWGKIAANLKGRTARQCRDRWVNYLNPELVKKEWAAEEDNLLMEMYKEFGTRWKDISLFFQGRSLNCIRNRVFKLERRNRPKMKRRQNKIQTNDKENKETKNDAKQDISLNDVFVFDNLEEDFLNGNEGKNCFQDWIIPNL